MTWLNYHHLYYFYVIAKEGGVAKASRFLRLGQPTLSTQLRQFEDALGTKLFLRQGKQLVLTEAGRIAFDYASEIFRLGTEFIQTLTGGGVSSSRMVLKVGVLDSLPKTFLKQMIESVQSVGNSYVSVTEGPMDVLLRELGAHRLDLVMSSVPAPASTTLKYVSRSIGSSQVVVMGGKRFQGLKRKFPESLTDQPFFFPTAHSKLRSDIDHVFRLHNVKVIPLGETQDTALQKLLVASGQTLAAMSRVAAESLLEQKAAIVIGTLPNIEEQYWLISMERRMANPLAAHLSESFKILEKPLRSSRL